MGAASLVLGLALALGAVAPAAQAAPYNCPVSGTGNSRSTVCHQYSGSAGSYRVAVFCIAWTTASSTGRFVYGPWRGGQSGQPSVAWCEWFEYVGSAYPQTRN